MRQKVFLGISNVSFVKPITYWQRNCKPLESRPILGPLFVEFVRNIRIVNVGYF